MAGGQIALILGVIVCSVLLGALVAHLLDSWHCVRRHHVEVSPPAA